MKMTPTHYRALRAAIVAAGGLSPDATMRERWDTLWRSRIDVSQFYRHGLNDDHIDTALRRVAKEQATS